MRYSILLVLIFIFSVAHAQGPTTITFNDLSNPGRALNGQYAGIDWGTSVWYLSAPWSQFSTNSISFSTYNRTSGNFTLSGRLVQFDALNGGVQNSIVSMSCGGNPTKTVTVSRNVITTVTTDWTGDCSGPVTLTSSNSWNTNFDNLVVTSGVSGTPTATLSPTATALPTIAPAVSCTEWVGYSQTNNWWWAFEGIVGTASYEMLYQPGGAAHYWADPNYVGWSNNSISPCSSASTRIVLDITHDAYLTAANVGSDPVDFMEAVIRSEIATVRLKRPTLQQILLQPVVGGPNEAVCSWPAPTEQNAIRASFNHPIIHQAIDRVVGGDVAWGPHTSVTSCSHYDDSTGHLTGGGGTSGGSGIVGQQVANFFLQIPTPTATPTPAPTFTPTLTAVPSATPTPTPIARCYSDVRITNNVVEYISEFAC